MSSGSFRFVHCADLHLDSTFSGISYMEQPLAGMLGNAISRAFDRVVDTAIDEGAGFIVIAGDIYERGNAGLKGQLCFRDAVRRASEAGVGCFLVRGNHDPLDSLKSVVTLPPSVEEFGPGLEVKTFSSGGEIQAEIYGISYESQEEFRNLASLFTAEGDPSVFRIGLLHCNLGGNPGHGNYAPCTMADLERAGMDYWALGHIHTPEIVRPANPSVVYAGNIQGRDIGETGKRGCYLVEVDDGKVASIDFRSTAQIIWSDLVLDVTGIADAETLTDNLRDLCDRQRKEMTGIPSIARVTLEGSSEIVRLIENRDSWLEVLDLVRDEERRKLDPVWIQSVRNLATLPMDTEKLRKGEDFIADFLGLCDRAREDPSALPGMLENNEAFRIVREFLGNTKDPSFLAGLVDEAEKLGLSELTRGAER